LRRLKTPFDTLINFQQYYYSNSLKANTSKSQVFFFTSSTNSFQKLKWNGQQLENCHYPTYLSITLDCSLIYKKHIRKRATKLQPAITYYGLRVLTCSQQWGASPELLLTTALALSYSTAEYTCPVRERSNLAKRLDHALNESCRLITDVSSQLLLATSFCSQASLPLKSERKL